MKGGTGGSALVEVDGTRGIGKGGGAISGSHNDPNTHMYNSQRINPDPRPPLSFTIRGFFLNQVQDVDSKKYSL